ncbi:MAG: type IV secretion system protein [Burkholderiaceae bacterium]
MKPFMRIVAGIVVACSLSVPMAVRAQGIPVIDAASIVKFIEQIALAKQQIDIVTRQMEAMTGNRSIGSIFNDPGIRAALPEDVRGLLGQLEGEMSSLDAATNAILSKVRAPAQNIPQERAALQERMVTLDARQQALNQRTYEALNRRNAELDALQREINSTQDTKAIQELQARIQIAQSNIAIEQQRAEAGRRQIEMEKEMVRHRAEQLYSGWISAPLKPAGAATQQ